MTQDLSETVVPLECQLKVNQKAHTALDAYV